MATPIVQSLQQVLAEIDPAYAPQRQLLQKQQSLIPGQQSAAIGGLDVAKQNSFRDINSNANSKGMAFSGIPAAEQTRYVGEKYLPARAALESDFQKQGFNLAQALASLQGEQRLKALDTRGGQEKTLQAYLEAERDRAFKASEGAKDRASRASSQPAQINPAKEFLNYIGGQFKGAGGQGNTNVTRQQQDRWVEAFFAQNQVPVQARQGYWDLINNTYNRASNYWEDPRYRK